jgi:hypothetical protein
MTYMQEYVQINRAVERSALARNAGKPIFSIEASMDPQTRSI